MCLIYHFLGLVLTALRSKNICTHGNDTFIRRMVLVGFATLLHGGRANV